MWVWESIPGPLEEQEVILTTKPPPQPITGLLKFFPLRTSPLKFLIWFGFFESESYCVTLALLELTDIHLPVPPKHGD